MFTFLYIIQEYKHACKLYEHVHKSDIETNNGNWRGSLFKYFETYKLPKTFQTVACSLHYKFFRRYARHLINNPIVHFISNFHNICRLHYLQQHISSSALHINLLHVPKNYLLKTFVHILLIFSQFLSVYFV